MTKNFTFFLLLLTLIFVLPSCETDVELDAEWKEITVVYGLLNQLDSTHYLRINKAFLGGDALQMAKIPDSSGYRNNLEVTLEGWDSGEKVQTITLDTTTVDNKDSGMWYNPYMVAYKGAGVLDPGFQYRLKIKNVLSGHEVSSVTNLIHDFFIKKPVAGGRLTLFRGFNTAFSWSNGKNARRYEPLLRFYYYEIPSGSTDTTLKHIDWYLSTITSNNLQGEGEVEISFGNDGFYDFVKNVLEKESFEGKRLCGTVDFIISAGGDEYDTYMRVNGPSYSLVQDRPEYTNIQNGLGLFSSRYSIFRNKRLDPRAEDEIIALDLKFVKNVNL
ncbi:MAG: DUF4249 family protein [Sphingobacteriia bacterium]|nr:DUF4249 family protein [Sphingobacteriia bacterium]